MKRENPFPGINPWMQDVWSDLHVSLIGKIRDSLGNTLPADLNARAEESVHLEGDGIDSVKGSLRRPDVAVLGPEDEPWKQGQAPSWQRKTPGEHLGSPVLVMQQDVDLTPRWVEIRTAKGRLITVIEVTGPHNKTSRAREEFEKKQQDRLQAGVSVVEIDLIRSGVGARDYRIGDWPREPAQIIVNRANRLSCAEVYPCPLRERIPAFRVPLRDGEPDAILDVQPLLDQCHLLGRYWQLPYDQPPNAPLNGDDLAWARMIAAEAGLRQEASETPTP